jgi:hypothetical protein
MDATEVERAIRRLADALNALDAVIEMRLDDDRERGSLGEQVHAFSADRARLAAELDGAQACVTALEAAHAEAAGRIDEAMSTVRAVIAANEG